MSVQAEAIRAAHDAYRAAIGTEQESARYAALKLTVEHVKGCTICTRNALQGNAYCLSCWRLWFAGVVARGADAREKRGAK